MVILFMSHRQPLLHELLAALGVHTDTHWVTRRRGIVTKDFSHLLKQADS